MVRPLALADVVRPLNLDIIPESDAPRQLAIDNKEGNTPGKNAQPRTDATPAERKLKLKGGNPLYTAINDAQQSAIILNDGPLTRDEADAVRDATKAEVDNTRATDPLGYQRLYNRYRRESRLHAIARCDGPPKGKEHLFTPAFGAGRFDTPVTAQEVMIEREESGIPSMEDARDDRDVTVTAADASTVVFEGLSHSDRDRDLKTDVEGAMVQHPLPTACFQNILSTWFHSGTKNAPPVCPPPPPPHCAIVVFTNLQVCANERTSEFANTE
jgi:hypothetical protein